ncbi:hypothetical protein [Riemerella anatipestifer]|uniref:hypothetical protein n=1 Tax=Riemerella anatipestifer TaxID=34085 RepID=UPI0007ECDFDD|nr:hypothetical protein [Riemerella anatipestifer]OBP62430.1 hypothetical protein AWB84_08315 [Riemerella anatipestifer]
MTQIELFVESLGHSVPKDDKEFIDSLQSKVSSDDTEDIEYRKNEIIGTYFPKKKNKKITEFHDLILDFIFNYELDEFDMFSVHFYAEHEVGSNKNYILIGSYEGAELAIDKESNLILLLDIDGTKICKCANDGREFLYTLLNLNSFVQKKPTLEEKKHFIKETVNISTKEQYNFWLTLVGEWDE